MPFSTDIPNGIMRPDELRMVQSVFKRILAEGRLPTSLDIQHEFASYLIRIYFRGMVVEDKLYEIGVAAAKERFSAAKDARLPMCRVLVVEDDYFLAKDIQRSFEQAGAIVIGPIGREEDVLSLLDGEVPDLAIIDLNLGDGVSFKIAETLHHQSVPITIYTAYKRSGFGNLPEDVREAVWLEKPASMQDLVRVAANTLR